MNGMCLAHQLLVAMPGLEASFRQSVILLVEHDDNGAMGIALNRPSPLTLTEILEDLDISVERPLGAHHQVVEGGPLRKEAGFVLHPPTTGDWGSGMEVLEGLSLTTSRDILDAIARGAGPERSLIALGYAGWGPGQLEQELADNAWLTTPASEELIFEVPFNERWHAAARQMGVNMSLISPHAGHG